MSGRGMRGSSSSSGKGREGSRGQSPGEAAVFGLKYQARCLCNVPADLDTNTFFVGTHNLLNENEFYILVYNEDDQRLFCQNIYTHRPEIWGLSACPWKSSLFASSYHIGGVFQASLWRIPSMDGDIGDAENLEESCTLKGHDGVLNGLHWGSPENRKNMITVDQACIRLWDVHAATSEAQPTQTVHLGDLQRLVCSAWDPRDENRVYAASEKSVDTVDIRAGKVVQTLSQPHPFGTRTLDCNPNVPGQIVTAGDDLKIRFWDTRKLTEPLLCLPSAHSHWISSVSYNPSYDQLVLTSSSDSLVNLFNVRSVSSAAEEESATSGETGGLATSVDKHEESVYSACWSSASAWVFASLSYDGRVLVHQVDSAIKFPVLGVS